MKEVSLDMDSEKKLKINEECDCCIGISLRNIIETGLKPVMKDIASAIAASLTNKILFGNYEVDSLFVLGDPFDLSYGSKIHTVYAMITQEAMDDGLHLKEKDTRLFVIRESLFRLIAPVTHSKPYMYDRFIIGTLCQVSSRAFAIRFIFEYTSYHMTFKSSSIRNRNEEIKKTIDADGSYLVIIQKGEPISTKKLMLTYDARSADEMGLRKLIIYIYFL